MKKKRIWIAIVVACLASIMLMLRNQKDLSISKVNWKCQNSKCEVTFIIENNTNNYLPINISLRAHKQEYVHGSDAMLTKIVGEKIIENDLKPNEIRDFEESFNVSSKMIYLVTVNAWDTEN